MRLEGTQPELLIGSPAGDHIRLEVVGRAHPGADDYWDGNWLTTRVSIRAGGFRASYEACLRTDELKSFRDQLEAAYERLDRSASFESMEQWLAIVATGDGRGHFSLRCTARDAAGVGNRLDFDLAIDQTQLPPILQALDELLAAHPVAGTP